MALRLSLRSAIFFDWWNSACLIKAHEFYILRNSFQILLTIWAKVFLAQNSSHHGMNCVHILFSMICHKCFHFCNYFPTVRIELETATLLVVTFHDSFSPLFPLHLIDADERSNCTFSCSFIYCKVMKIMLLKSITILPFNPMNNYELMLFLTH